MFYVHYESGSCNYGDHSTGLEPFATQEEADKFINELYAKHGDDVTVSMIKGEMLTIVVPDKPVMVCLKPWQKPNEHGENPGDICCQRAAGGVCYEHNKNNYMATCTGLFTPMLSSKQWNELDKAVNASARLRLEQAFPLREVKLDVKVAEEASRKVCEAIERMVLDGESGFTYSGQTYGFTPNGASMPEVTVESILAMKKELDGYLTPGLLRPYSETRRQAFVTLPGEAMRLAEEIDAQTKAEQEAIKTGPTVVIMNLLEDQDLVDPGEARLD